MKRFMTLALSTALCMPLIGCSERQQLENEMEDVQEQRQEVEETQQNAIEDIQEEEQELLEEQRDVQQEAADDVPADQTPATTPQ